MPGPYSAGSIFLQVIPSFRGVPEAIAREGRAWGKVAGQEFDKGFENEVRTGAARAMRQGGAAASGEARKAGSNAGGDFAGSFMDRVKTAVVRANREVGAIRIDGDDTAFLHAVDRVTQRLARLTSKKNDINMGLDDTQLYVELHALEHELDQLNRQSVTVEAKANTTAAVAEVRAAITEINALADNVTVQVDADTGAAMAELAALNAEASHLDGKSVHVQAGVDGAAAATAELAGLDAAAKRVSRSTGDAGNAFRAFSGIVLGVVALGPAVIPVLTTLAGAAAALGPLGAVGIAGIGTAALGLSGVGTAVKALSQQQKSSGSDAITYAKAVRSATNSVVTAQEALSTARTRAARDAESSARAIASADAGVVSAERNLGQAQQAAKQAQQDLTRARQDAVKANRDLELSARGGVIAEKQAVLDLADAQANYRKVLADPKSTSEQRQRALLDLQQQKLSLDEIRARNSDIASQQAQFAKTGVNGTQQVISAQQRLQQATQGVGDAQRSVADARASAAQARATADQQAIDDQRTIGDAQRALVQAQANYRDALDKTTASQRNVNAAMAALGPAGQQFAKFLFGLAPYLAQLRQAAGEGFLPGLQKWFEVITGFYGPALLRTLSGLSTALGGMFSMFAQALMAPPFQKFFAMIERDGPVFIGMMGQILTNLGLGVASLITAMVPLSYLFGGWLVQATAAFAKWAAALPNTTGFQQFLEIVRRDGPLVGQLVGALAGALLNLGKALLPYAEGLVRVLTAVLHWVAQMDPNKLGAIAIGLIGIILTFQAIVGFSSLFSGAASALGVLTGGIALFTGTAEGAAAILTGIIGATVIVIAALALLGAAVYLAYTHFDWFRKGVDAAWQGIQTAAHVVVAWFQTYVVPVLQQVWQAIGIGAQYLWQNILQPIWGLMQHVFTDVMNGLSWAWQNIGKPVFDLIGSIISFLWNNVIKPIWSNIAPLILIAFKLIAGAWIAVGQPVFNALIKIVGFLWDYVIKPIFIAIGFAFKVLVTAMSWYWNNILKPVFTVIMAVAQVLFRILVVVVFGAIALAWNGLMVSMKQVWDNILHPVWKAIVAVANWLGQQIKASFKQIGDGWNVLVKGMRWVHDKILAPMWGLFKGALKALADYFGITTKTIGSTWDAIKAIVGTPINFLIGVVFNKGLFKAWNWAVNALGLPKNWAAPMWPQIQGRGVQQFAAGGRVPGWSPHDKADNIPAMLTAKEFVHPVDAVDYYGVDTMELIRRKKIPREMLEMAHYAGGGMVASVGGGGNTRTTWPALDDIRRRMFPGSVLTSAYRPGAHDYHGAGEAIDIGVPGNLQSGLMPIAAALARAFPNSTELIHNPNGSIKNGHPVSPGFWGPATWAAHANHVHWAMTPESLAGKGGGNGNGSGFWAGIWNGVTGFLGKTWKTATDVFGSLTDSIKGVGQMATKFGKSPLVQQAGKIPGNLLGKMWSGAKDKIGQFFSDIVLQGATESPLAQNAEGYKQMARRVLVPFGWGSGPQWNAFDSVVTRESGWNPTAQNPTSTASGLGQFINSTWRLNRSGAAAAFPTMKSAPPGQQVLAIVRYMKDRYTDAIGAKNFWDSHHWYGEGGEVTNAPHGQAPITPDLMDTGGYIRPGLNVIMNKTRRAEPVINPATLDNLQAIANGGGQQAVIGELNLPIMTQATPESIAGEILHQVTVARRGGKY